VSGRLDATHVPVVLDADRGELGSLRFHLARANPTSKALTDDREVLMVFVGPHTYVSPDWYATDNLVPTWNYAVVHGYGVPRTLDDAELRRLLDDLGATQESRLPKTPWTRDKMPPELVDKMCKAIIGFELRIAGKVEIRPKEECRRSRRRGRGPRGTGRRIQARRRREHAGARPLTIFKASARKFPALLGYRAWHVCPGI
jgi:predicted FMN-binding regulatory protein PaiB